MLFRLIDLGLKSRAEPGGQRGLQFSHAWLIPSAGVGHNLDLQLGGQRYLCLPGASHQRSKELPSRINVVRAPLWIVSTKRGPGTARAFGNRNLEVAGLDTQWREELLARGRKEGVTVASVPKQGKTVNG
jgi:hypothetical protein